MTDKKTNSPKSLATKIFLNTIISCAIINYAYGASLNHDDSATASKNIRKHNIKSAVKKKPVVSFPVPKIKTKAKQAIVMHCKSTSTTFVKNAEQTMAPSSMVKILLLYLAFHKLKNHEIDLKDKIIVSKNAYKQIGTRMFLKMNEKINLHNLLLGIGIVSGNDASVALADLISGSCEVCAQQMNFVAKNIGAINTFLINTAGIPEPSQVYNKQEFEQYMAQTKEQQLLCVPFSQLQNNPLQDINIKQVTAFATITGGLSTAYDIALIMKKLIKDFPVKALTYLGQHSFRHNKIKQPNKLNLLMKRFNFVKCGKTGFTDYGGYGLVAFADNGIDQYVVVVNGCKSKMERIAEAEKLLRFSFQNFKLKTIALRGDIIARVQTWGGTIPEAQITTKQDISLILPKSYLYHQKSLQVKINLDKLLVPPLSAGETVGTLEVQYINSTGILTKQTYPLITKQEVKKSIIFKRLWQYGHYMLFGYNSGTKIKSKEKT